MSILPYRPHPLFRSGHLQTLMVGLKTGPSPPYHACPILVDLPDDEALVVHEECGPTLATNAHLVILIHGLGGDHRSAYLERLAPRLRGLGFAVWRVDLRGCGAGLAHAWRPANAGRSHDLAEVLLHAENRYPGRPVHVVGFSLSGNIVLKMLGEAGAGQSRLDLARSALATATAIAPPARLADCANNMDRWSRRLYTKYYLRVLDQQVQLRAKQWQRWHTQRADCNAAAVKTIRQFDARYTAPLSGYANTDEYYRLASAAPWLPNIQTPAEIVADRHDPIIPFATLNAMKAELSPSTELTVTKFGGHMGYFGLDEQGRMIRWMEHYVAQRLVEARQQIEA